MTLLYMAAGLLGLVMINVPIAVALGVVSVIAMLISSGTATLPNMAMVLYDGATSFPLLAIPLFIFAGAIMNSASPRHWSGSCAAGSPWSTWRPRCSSRKSQARRSPTWRRSARS
jgi:hypothetical protein